MRSGAGGVSASRAASERRAASARWNDGHCITACSIGASARPSRIDAAIMMPGVTWPRIASQAPSPSIIDCRNRRSVREVTLKRPFRSDIDSRRSSISPLSARERDTTASCMPSPCTVSLPARICSTKCADRAAASPASTWSLEVPSWLSSAMTSRRRPEKTARSPSIQWKVNSANRKTGVQGASKKANGPDPDAKRWMVSRSRRPVAGRARSAGDTDRESTARSTRESSRSCRRAPARAITRARAWSSMPIIRNRKATMPINATSVASEREVSTRS